MKTLIEGRQINYEIINPEIYVISKPVLVFLHEGLGSIRQWKDFPQKLCDSLNLRGLIYDRYGYGLSDSLKEQRKTTFLHDEGLIFLPGLIANLKIKNKIILVGHSDGATIALIFASMHSDKLLCVISEAAHVMLEEISLTGIKKIKEEYQNSESLRKMFLKYHPGKADKMFYGWVNTWLSPDFVSWNIEKLLNSITVPVLAIQGNQDEYGSYEQLASIKRNMSADAEILFIPDCGHTPHFQAQNIVIYKMVTFVSNFMK
jgi:pimeloyl-ACP methyl ester carboxylesterase